MKLRLPFLLLLVATVAADVCLTKRSIYVRSGPSKSYPIVKYIQKGIKFLCDKPTVDGYVKVHGEKEYVSFGAVSFVKGSNAYDPVPSAAENKSNWPRFAKPFTTSGAGVKYFLQNDPRWSNVPYTIHNDKYFVLCFFHCFISFVSFLFCCRFIFRRQTIGSSGCGPTCAAMAIVTLTGADTNPLKASKFALIHGDRYRIILISFSVTVIVISIFLLV